MDTADNRAPETADRMCLTHDAPRNLLAAAKWAKFIAIASLAIYGLVIIGILATLGQNTGSMDHARGMDYGAMSTMTTPMPRGFMFIYLVIILIAMVQAVFMLQFASHTKKAIAAGDSQTLTKGFSALKNYYVLYGIMMIVVLALLVFTFIFATMWFAMI